MEISRPLANSKSSCLKRTAQSLLLVKTSKKVKSGESALLHGSLYSSPPHPVGPPMERPLPQIAGAWWPLGDGRNNIVLYWDRLYCIVLGDCPLPLGPPISGEPGPPLGNGRPGRRPTKHAILYVTLYRPHGFKGSALCSCCPVDPSRYNVGSSDVVWAPLSVILWSPDPRTLLQDEMLFESI